MCIYAHADLTLQCQQPRDAFDLGSGSLFGIRGTGSGHIIFSVKVTLAGRVRFLYYTFSNLQAL
jgi:hypothetical protein